MEFTKSSFFEAKFANMLNLKEIVNIMRIFYVKVYFNASVVTLVKRLPDVSSISVKKLISYAENVEPRSLDLRLRNWK